MASKCISKLTRLRPPSVSPNSPNHGLQVRIIMASKCICNLIRSRPASASPISLDHGLKVYLQTRSITACKVARAWPPKCMFKVAQLPSWSASLSSAYRGLQVCLQIHPITTFKCIFRLARSRPPKCISESTQSSFSSAPRIALKHHLQPVQIYCV